MSTNRNPVLSVENPTRLDVQAIRKDFPGLAQQINGFPLVYLDE